MAFDRASQAVEFVKPDGLHRPAVTSVRATALPTNCASASSNAWRIVNAQRFAVVAPASLLIAMLLIFGNENRSAKNHPLPAH